ncbi:sulfurtransferase-like selenium metabolism protein YedF [Anaerotruncus sp. AF02-27]|uniref:sulfurtransferase-like selenium metabolism protein YedF n=1 Tax=Anaerotruncus TaxID=244127 RepID=UPI000E52EE3A|nr:MULTISPECIES: sulfurtransferase-like selenium metabolism protein YedF [Anaerotruncus]RGX53302.1 sulfurtransferase-like selenium metabolism protein YedF [Anaerotruncus sp. AF02-27]
MITVDAKGKNCPIPVILAKKEIDAGARAFTVLVDNPAAVENLTRLADSQGYAIDAAEADGVYTVSFSIAGGPVCEAQPILRPKNGSWSVFVPRDTIGDGDPELGTSLIKMYFYTIAQSDDPPASILFINAGVKLPVFDDQIVEHLQALVEKGVEILVCGTCLNFYGIAGQLRIGTASNMYDITERMRQADKVVTL